MLIYQNFGADFRERKSGYQSQKRPVLPPVYTKVHSHNISEMSLGYYQDQISWRYHEQFHRNRLVGTTDKQTEKQLRNKFLGDDTSFYWYKNICPINVSAAITTSLSKVGLKQSKSVPLVVEKVVLSTSNGDSTRR